MTSEVIYSVYMRQVEHITFFFCWLLHHHFIQEHRLKRQTQYTLLIYQCCKHSKIKTIKIKKSSFKSSENIQKKEGVPDRKFKQVGLNVVKCPKRCMQNNYVFAIQSNLHKRATFWKDETGCYKQQGWVRRINMKKSITQ